MLKKIKSMLAVIGIKPTQEVNSLKPTTIQEDPRDNEARKRTANHIKQNYELIMARALRPHGYKCEDNISCQKEDCWQWEPDKIMSEPYEVKR